MLSKIRNTPSSKVTKDDLLKIFSEKSIYQDYVNMLRKKFQFMRAYHSLQNDESLFLVSGITRNFIDKDNDNEIKPYSRQTYIYSKNQKPTLLYEPIETTYTKIKIMVENETGYENIELTPIVTKRIIKYLSTYDETSGDCNDFELHMLGTDAFSYNEIIWPESWDGDLNDLKSGDCISLLKSECGRSKHKACYLGNGLFISKFGKSHLGISTLEQMNDFYSTKFMTLNRYFRDTKSYEKMKQDRIEMLKTHPDRERLEEIFANIGKLGFC